MLFLDQDIRSAAIISSTGTQTSSNFHLQISKWETILQDLDVVTDSAEDEEHHTWISVSRKNLLPEMSLLDNFAATCVSAAEWPGKWP